MRARCLLIITGCLIAFNSHASEIKTQQLKDDVSEKIILSKELHLEWKSNTPTVSVFRNDVLIQKIEGGSSVDFLVKAKDFNFDGINDIEILRDRGTEEYYDIYIYDENNKQFRKHAELSSLPCPSTEGSRYVVGRCFNSNACEHWEDYFQWKGNRLSLAKRIGFTCDPETGKGFKYFEEYSNGRQISREAKEVVE